jgi:hypothetical protein
VVEAGGAVPVQLNRCGAELYLGLVHFRDGADGARRRIETGLGPASTFGVAPSAGWAVADPVR